jgi:hypothetical protein
MDITALRSLALDVAMATLAVPAIVTPDGGLAVHTTAIWVATVEEQLPVGRDFQRREPRRILALPVADVPSVPRGSVIVAPAPGGTVARTWVVDGVDRSDADQLRVIVKAQGA